MTETINETDEQRATREAAEAAVIAYRASRALQSAADIVLHVRALALTGKTERGETLPEWSAPMRITAVDDVDEVYARIIEWVTYWSKLLVTLPTATSIVAWHNSNGELGFKAGTTPEGAAMLVRIQTMWLLTRHEIISRHPASTTYHEDLIEFVWALRSKYPKAPRPPRPVSSRPCPTCGEFAVGAVWASDAVTDVIVSCAHCGETFESSPRKLLEWLPQEAQLQFERAAVLEGADPYTGIVPQETTTGATS